MDQLLKERLARDLANIELIDDATADTLRRITPAQRIHLMFVANDIGRALFRMGIKLFHPDWDEARVARAVADMMLHGED